jgi:hypothetical protein
VLGVAGGVWFGCLGRSIGGRMKVPLDGVTDSRQIAETEGCWEKERRKEMGPHTGDVMLWW